MFDIFNRCLLVKYVIVLDTPGSALARVGVGYRVGVGCSPCQGGWGERVES